MPRRSLTYEEVCLPLKTYLLDEIREIVEKTKETGLEHGFSVCKLDDKLEAGPICTGTECYVDIEKCKRGEKVGEVHTHPNSVTFSAVDIYNAIREGLEFTCVARPTGYVECLYIPPLRRREDAKEYVEEWVHYEEACREGNPFACGIAKDMSKDFMQLVKRHHLHCWFKV